METFGTLRTFPGVTRDEGGLIMHKRTDDDHESSVFLGLSKRVTAFLFIILVIQKETWQKQIQISVFVCAYLCVYFVILTLWGLRVLTGIVI